MAMVNRDMAPETAALALARGCYQRMIAEGNARMSGADIRGKARQWAVRYHHSRWNYIARCRANGLEPVFRGTGKSGSPVMVDGWRWA